MCGRYELNATPQQIAARFGVLDVPAFPPSFDVRPTEMAPVIRLDRSGRRCAEMMRWGLVPYWAKDLKVGNRCFNARAETVDRLPAFRRAFEKRRCIVPASAFYEWQKAPDGRGRKRKLRIALPEGELLGIAGLWEYWRAAGGEPVISFTILTTDPNAELKPIHDRMPLVLREEDFEHWLHPDPDDPGALPDAAAGDTFAIVDAPPE